MLGIYQGWVKEQAALSALLPFKASSGIKASDRAFYVYRVRAGNNH